MKQVIPKDTKFRPLDTERLYDTFEADRTEYCCGVLEIGGFSLKTNPFKDVVLKSVEEVSYTYQSSTWGFVNHTYKPITMTGTKPKYTKPASYEDIVKALKKIETDDWSKRAGMGIAFLRPEQIRNGWYQVFKDLGWTEGQKFYNPNTRRILTPFSKIFRKSAPRRKKTSKSILSRG